MDAAYGRLWLGRGQKSSGKTKCCTQKVESILAWAINPPPALAGSTASSSTERALIHMPLYPAIFAWIDKNGGGGKLTCPSYKPTTHLPLHLGSPSSTPHFTRDLSHDHQTSLTMAKKDEQKDDGNLLAMMMEQANGLDFSDPADTAGNENGDPNRLMVEGFE